MQYTREVLDKILENHSHWIKEDVEGWQNMRANLWGANLWGANLRGAKNVPFIPMACPDTGSFVGWKKARNGEIIKLLIPEDAKRSSATGRKCRCDRAVVLSIEKDGIIHDKPEPDFFACSHFNTDFVYRVGKTVSTNDFCDDRFRECAPGIHFFINRQEAVEYVF